MPSVVGISDIWKMVDWLTNVRKGHDLRQKAQVVAWLEEVSQELDKLSEIWLKICADADYANRVWMDEAESNLLSKLFGVLRMQSGFATRLEAFYASASTVLAKRTRDDFFENFINQLGTLLYHRNNARNYLDKKTKVWMIDAGNNQDMLMNMQDAAAALQREMAALHVLIANFKAKA